MVFCTSCNRTGKWCSVFRNINRVFHLFDNAIFGASLNYMLYTKKGNYYSSRASEKNAASASIFSTRSNSHAYTTTNRNCQTTFSYTVVIVFVFVFWIGCKIDMLSNTLQTNYTRWTVKYLSLANANEDPYPWSNFIRCLEFSALLPTLMIKTQFG
mgnify:CR=1 FL=1